MSHGRPGEPSATLSRPVGIENAPRNQNFAGDSLGKYARSEFCSIVASFSGARASRSGSALRANLARCSVRTREARPSRNTAHSDESGGRPFRSESTRSSEATSKTSDNRPGNRPQELERSRRRKTSKIESKIDQKSSQIPSRGVLIREFPTNPIRNLRISRNFRIFRHRPIRRLRLLRNLRERPSGRGPQE